MPVNHEVRLQVLKELRAELGDRVLDDPVIDVIVDEFGPLALFEASALLGISTATVRIAQISGLNTLAEKFPELREMLPDESDFDPRLFIG
jgi:hypothetical protein